jgi:hypothetical protein
MEAAKLAGRLLMDQPETFWEGCDWHIEVTDDSGAALFRLDFWGNRGRPYGRLEFKPMHYRGDRRVARASWC